MDPNKMIEDLKGKIAWMREWWFTMILIIVVLLIFIFALFMGYVSMKSESMTCMEGNQSALCSQGRDGAGEGLTNSALAQGFGADPNAFCQGAGEPTNDAWDFLNTSAQGLPATSESFN
jgi:hypothetical protein